MRSALTLPDGSRGPSTWLDGCPTRLELRDSCGVAGRAQVDDLVNQVGEKVNR